MAVHPSAEFLLAAAAALEDPDRSRLIRHGRGGTETRLLDHGEDGFSLIFVRDGTEMLRHSVEGVDYSCLT